MVKEILHPREYSVYLLGGKAYISGERIRQFRYYIGESWDVVRRFSDHRAGGHHRASWFGDDPRMILLMRVGRNSETAGRPARRRFEARFLAASVRLELRLLNSTQSIDVAVRASAAEDLAEEISLLKEAVALLSPAMDQAA